MRALGILFIVFVESENRFEWLMAIKADVIVNGHGEPPVESLMGEL